MKSHCLIIEDEPQSKERLELLLAKYHQDTITVKGWAKNYEEAISFLSKSSFDLVFFDIQIQGYNAFDILSELDIINFDIIFTTAYDVYAVKAFRINAIDYLLKPISKDELGESIAKHLKRKQKISPLTQHPKTANELNFNNRIEIPTAKGFDFIPIKEIIRCEADGNYTIVFLRNKSKMTVSKTLKEFEKVLEKHHFIRPHHSHLVNIEDIQAYHKGKGGVLILSDHTEIEVASRRKEEVLRILKSS